MTILSVRLLVFTVDGQRFALRLAGVERVIRAVALERLPGAPAVIAGIFSLHGLIIPVADPRRRLGLPEREIGVSDRIVIARSPRRPLGLLTQGDTGIESCREEDIVAAEKVIGAGGTISGIGRLSSGLVLIHDLARFLSLDEEAALGEALHGTG